MLINIACLANYVTYAGGTDMYTMEKYYYLSLIRITFLIEGPHKFNFVFL